MKVALPALPDVHEKLRRISVDEFHRMIEAGILREDEAVQLIDGLLVAMSPQDRPHAYVIQELNRLLVRSLGDEYKVLTQLPLTLGDESEPEPDLAVVRTEDASSAEHHPRTALLVVEVAGDSLRFDRRAKASLYARAGIPEYWIVNLGDSAVEAYRDPDVTSGTYRETSTFRAGETLTASAVKGLRIDVAVFFP
jgi:Uma2 family endonuclease